MILNERFFVMLPGLGGLKHTPDKYLMCLKALSQSYGSPKGGRNASKEAERFFG